MGIKDVFTQRECKVLYALKEDGKSPYGDRVYVQDDLGNRFLFAHLAWFACAQGDILKPWETFAEMGETGYCKSGAHLHLSMFDDSDSFMGAEEAIDPTLYIKKYGYPCNTRITNEFGSKHCNPKLDGHEGIDFSSWREIV